MNREIKFRAWDGREMRGEERAGPLADSEWIGINDLIKAYKTSGWILMQFTGLKDKTGKEIYDGDILKNHGYIGEVKWRKSGFQQYMHNSLGWHVLNEEDEVIGNIYENPELLPS